MTDTSSRPPTVEIGEVITGIGFVAAHLEPAVTRYLSGDLAEAASVIDVLDGFRQQLAEQRRRIAGHTMPPVDESDDWTVGPDGRSNTSDTYRRLVADVESLIRQDAHKLIAGRADATAGLIVAQLAHRHGMRPTLDDALTVGEREPGHPQWHAQVKAVRAVLKDEFGLRSGDGKTDENAIRILREQAAEIRRLRGEGSVTDA